MYNLSDVFREIASIPAPSGYEQSIRASLMRLVSSYVDEYQVDIQGNLICYRHGSCVSRHQTIMFVAHMDEIGMMVSYSVILKTLAIFVLRESEVLISCRIKVVT